MTLTLGSGPFARPRTGQLNFDLDAAAPGHVLYLHDVGRRIRGVLAGETVVDTTDAKLLHETGLLPQWYVPLAAVRADVLTATDHHTTCPFKGEASYWSLRVGDRVEGNAVWGYPEPLAGCPPIGDLVAVYFDRLDGWYEEDEEVLGHPRDPFHRVDTRATSRHVVVRVGGQTVADSTAAIGVFETGLPARWYLPAQDVRSDLLEPSETTSVCPYKGIASYESLRIGDRLIEDAAWCYREPLGEVLAVAGYRCFWGEDVTTLIDA